MGDWSSARKQFDIAERSAAKVGRGAEARRHLAYDRGRLALGEGNLAAAERLFTGFLAGLPPENHLHRHLAQVRLAEVAARRGDVATAERRITAASRELETWRDSLGDDELRRYAFAATALGEHDPQVPVARVLATLAGAGRVEAAFALAEQRRARLLTDRLNQAEALRETEVAAAPVHRARPLAAEEIAGSLPDSATAILEYVAGAEGSSTTVFILTHAGIQAAVLPSIDTLAPAIRRFVAPARERRAAGCAREEPGPSGAPTGDRDAARQHQASGHRARRTAAPGAVRCSGGRGRRPGRGTMGDRPRAVGQPRGLTLAETESRARSRRAGRGCWRWAIPPSRSSSPQRRRARPEIFRSAFAAAGGLPRLTGSGEEARSVARYAGGGSEVRVRGDASEAWLKGAALDRYRVIHLATHALVDETVADAYGAGARAGGRARTASSPRRISPRCTSTPTWSCSRPAARREAWPSRARECRGSRRRWSSAGARSVVATQWRVGDRSTVRLVADLYDGLAKGLPVADALREAKLAAIRRGRAAGRMGRVHRGRRSARAGAAGGTDARAGWEIWLRIAGSGADPGWRRSTGVSDGAGRKRRPRVGAPATVEPTHH